MMLTGTLRIRPAVTSAGRNLHSAISCVKAPGIFGPDTILGCGHIWSTGFPISLAALQLSSPSRRKPFPRFLLSFPLLHGHPLPRRRTGLGYATQEHSAHLPGYRALQPEFVRSCPWQHTATTAHENPMVLCYPGAGRPEREEVDLAWCCEPDRKLDRGVPRYHRLSPPNCR